ncbi:hypothetical protein BSL78_18455 [Apostichopus japonicus]|uniref:Uncharacterized protein n=1 Tax=Stichopus japonicus TaxID=307972 RepID=A0A2G8K9M7_STIJA|nr:hypothetical protein BSL78_18455 [Apostichopus japonicus]
MDDSPNHPDHDFSTAAGYKISPISYMFLEKDPASVITHQDKLGREHPLTIQTHVNDLVPLLMRKVSEGKTVTILIVDGGPDWNPRSCAVLFYLARLFKYCNLDLLCSTSYAPGQSAYNPIEHLWAPLSKKLTSAILPDHLEGELPLPGKQNISAQERTAKDQEVLDLAIGILRERLLKWT